MSCSKCKTGILRFPTTRRIEAESFVDYLCSPAYKKSHPTVQHIQPLAFAVGAAREDEGEVIYSDIEGSLAVRLFIHLRPLKIKRKDIDHLSHF